MSRFKVGDIVKRSDDTDKHVHRHWDLKSLGKIVQVTGENSVAVEWQDTRPVFPYNDHEIMLINPTPDDTIKIDMEVKNPEVLEEKISEIMKDVFSPKENTQSSMDSQIDSFYSGPGTTPSWAHFALDIGRTIFTERRKANMKRKRLARIVDLTKEDIKTIENGDLGQINDLRLTKLFDIFEALGVYPKLFAWQGWNEPQ